jgi:hypothetical protein
MWRGERVGLAVKTWLLTKRHDFCRASVRLLEDDKFG